jgi:glucosylceramidase
MSFFMAMFRASRSPTGLRRQDYAQYSAALPAGKAPAALVGSLAAGGPGIYHHVAAAESLRPSSGAKDETSMATTWVSSTAGSAWDVREATKARAKPGLLLTGREGQTIEGFGGCFNEMGWHALSVLDPATRDSVMAALFGPGEGCRFTMGRVPIGASDYALEWYSHSETDGDLAMKRFSIERDRAYLLPYVKAAMAQRPGLWLFASPWSPPAWMKTHKVFNYGTVRWEPDVLQALALYFLKFVRAYRKEGIDVRQVHVQNEPGADQKFPSCLWTGAEMREFIRDYLGPLFEREGLDCEVWLGTLNVEGYDEYVVSTLADEAARRYVAGIGLQWAGKTLAQRAHTAWPDLRIMQTENECGNGQNSWAYAHYVFTLLWHYLTNGTVAYCYWNMVLPAGGRSTWGWRQNSMVSVDEERHAVTYNPEFHVMKHVSRFVDAGAVRLDLTGPWAGNALAFRNPDGSRVVVAANGLDEPRRLVFTDGDAVVGIEAEPLSFNTLVLPA